MMCSDDSMSSHAEACFRTFPERPNRAVISYSFCSRYALVASAFSLVDDDMAGLEVSRKN